MAINQLHTAEEFDGVRCAVVEKLASSARVNFLKELLELNGYTVMVIKSPPPKTAAPVDPNAVHVAIDPPDETFTVGVTDPVFNSTNAIFGRLLHSRDGHVVTLDYWLQKSALSQDDVPYYQRKKF